MTLKSHIFIRKDRHHLRKLWHLLVTYQTNPFTHFSDKVLNAHIYFDDLQKKGHKIAIFFTFFKSLTKGHHPRDLCYHVVKSQISPCRTSIAECTHQCTNFEKINSMIIGHKIANFDFFFNFWNNGYHLRDMCHHVVKYEMNPFSHLWNAT